MPVTTANPEVDADIFGIEPNVAVMHQVVTAQLAARRAGTQSTKTRAEVAGGGAKPWRQKGTGRARHGSIRSPQWRGGGVALGPKPRSYRQRTPKKMIRLALYSALSDRAAEGNVVIVEDWGWSQPSTKEAVKALTELGLDDRRVLIVLSPGDEAIWKSFRNLQGVHVLSVAELNAYDVLVSDVVVFTTESVPTLADDAAADVPAEEPPASSAPEADAEPEAPTEDEAPVPDEAADEADEVGASGASDEEDPS